ncbi:MAG: peptidyl-prolyl cis-trans isomerase [Candidatus Omnitrophota bacterium]
MSRIFQKIGVLGVFFAILLVPFVSGCDQVKGYLDHVLGDKQKTADVQPPASSKEQTAEKTTAQTAAQEQQAQEEKRAEAEEEADEGVLPADVLAQVGDWSITLQEFNQRLDMVEQAMPDFDPTDLQQKQTILDQMLEQQLLVQEAERQGLHKDENIQLAIAEFRNTILAQKLLTEELEGVEVTEDDLRTFYEENKEMIIDPWEWHVAQIVVDSQAQAKELVAQINQGADFSEIAKQHSKGKAAAQGGDLGFIQEFPFDKMGQIIVALDTGEISNAFRGPDGYYIVKLLDKRGGEQKPLGDVKEDLKEAILPMKQQQQYLQYLSELQEKIAVDVQPELLEEQK